MGITYSEASLRSLMAARSSPGGFVVATVTNPGSFVATITHRKKKMAVSNENSNQLRSIEKQ